MNGVKMPVGLKFQPMGNYTIEQAIITIYRMYNSILESEKELRIDTLEDIEKVKYQEFNKDGGTLIIYGKHEKDIENNNEAIDNNDQSLDASSNQDSLNVKEEVKISVTSQENISNIQVGENIIECDGIFEKIMFVNLFESDDEYSILVYYQGNDKNYYANVYSYTQFNEPTFLTKVNVNGMFGSSLMCDGKGKIFGAYDIINNNIVGYTNLKNPLIMRRSIKSVILSNAQITSNIDELFVESGDGYAVYNSEELKDLGIGKEKYVSVKYISENKIVIVPNETGDEIVIKIG